MSATSVTGPVRNYVVRSKTPSNSEKVLLYLRGMEREVPENPLLDDPELEGSSQPAEHSAPGDDLPFKHPLSPRTQPTDPGRRATVESAGSHITYTDAGRPQNDAQSRAFGGSRAPSRTVPIQVVSPTPFVPMPNPKHISDQSWGNMGPLPGTEPARGTFGPVDVSMNWGAQQPVFNMPHPAQYAVSATGYPPLPPSTAGYPPQHSNAGYPPVHGSVAPSQAPLGATIINLTIQAPTDPNAASRAASVAPQSVAQSPQPSHSPAPDPPRSRPTTPMQRPPSRGPSPAQGTPKAAPLMSWDDEPSSPQGRAPSAHPSQMALPVSPRSTFTNNWGWEEPAGPPVPSKAPSHAPSARPQQPFAPSRAAPSMAPSMWAALAEGSGAQPAPSGRGGSIAPSHGWQAASAAPGQRLSGSVAPSHHPPASAAPSGRPPASAAPSQRPPRSTAPSQRPQGSVAPSHHHPPASAAPSQHVPPPASMAPSARVPASAAPSARPGPSHAPSQSQHQKSPSGGSQFGAGSRVTQLHPLSKLPTSPQSQHSRVLSPVPPPRSTAYQAMSARGSQVGGAGGDGYERSLVHRQPSPEQDEDYMDEGETEIVHELLTRTPRTSYTATPSVLAAEVNRSRHHDEDLCILLHAADDQYTHEVVKRAVRKAIRARLKKLGMKADNDAIRAYREVHNFEYHPTDPTPVIVQAPAPRDEAPPPWMHDLLQAMQKTTMRLDDLDKKLAAQRKDDGTDDGQSVETARPDETDRRASVTDGSESYDPEHDLHGHYGGGHSPLIPGETELDGTERMTYNNHLGSIHHHDGSHLAPESRRPRDDELDTIGDALRTIGGQTPPTQDAEGGARHALRNFMQSDQGSLGDQVYEQELYKLRMKPARTDATHQTWDITHADPAEAMPEIPDSDMGHVQGRDMYFDDARGASPGPHKDADPTPGAQNQLWHPPSPAPWQKIHQRLLDWAMVWPMSEFDKALNSTTRGHQVDEIALSIWTTQTYKRYVRMKLTENPPGVVDKMFVPPIVADAISSAVFSGRHSEASAMLRDLWTPFGLEGTPRLIIALSKNRRRENHWVVHRFDLTESTLSTYDTSIEKGVPDSRPLGWWFAIGAAFPGGPAPKSGHLYQNHVRMPRPLQYIIDNSVAAAAIWRNLLMSAKAERAIDLERLRDLVNMEVRNLRQRKEMGKLTAHVVPQTWEQLTGPIS